MSVPIGILFPPRVEGRTRLTPNICLFFMASPLLTMGPQLFLHSLSFHRPLASLSEEQR